MAYFERVSTTAFRATSHVGGAWAESEQHIAPALGLLAHVVERDRDTRRDDGLVLGRLSYDILGTVPVAEVETSVRVVRPGRTIELVEATLSHGGRSIVLLRAWLMAEGGTAALAGTPFPAIPAPEDTKPWDPTTVWPGGFIRSVEVRRDQHEPGRASYWVRTDVDLVAGEEASPLARTAGLLDIANGMTVRVSPEDVAFPNVDLTAHFLRQPTRAGGWVGFDTSVSFGPDGLGVTHSVVHDTTGPVGTVSQLLTVRPR